MAPLKDKFTPMSEIFTVAAKKRGGGGGISAYPNWNECMSLIVGLPETWARQAFIIIFVCFKTSPHLLQLFQRMQQGCFAVKLQKCFLDNETSPNFPSAWGWADNDWTEHFWVDFPFKDCTHMSLLNPLLPEKSHHLCPEVKTTHLHASTGLVYMWSLPSSLSCNFHDCDMAREGPSVYVRRLIVCTCVSYRGSAVGSTPFVVK